MCQHVGGKRNCAMEAPMEIPQVVKTYVEAWSARDLDRYLATFAQAGRYSDPTVAKPTLARDLKEHFAGFFAGFPDATFETVGLDAVSDHIWVWRWIWRGTHSGSLRGIPPTGRRVEVPGCEFIELRGNHVLHVSGYFDRLTMLTQLGLAPE
jgi:steroid delta-isomerase-like uncharacterized protein